MPSGRLLAAARTLLGLSQDELAGLAGINPSVLKRLEVGKTSPRQETVDAIVRVFTTHGLELLLETDDRVEGLILRKRATSRAKSPRRSKL